MKHELPWACRPLQSVIRESDQGELLEGVTALKHERDLYYPHCVWVFHRHGVPIKDSVPPGIRPAKLLD